VRGHESVLNGLLARRVTLSAVDLKTSAGEEGHVVGRSVRVSVGPLTPPSATIPTVVAEEAEATAEAAEEIPVGAGATRRVG
jgi:hypothetical protein